MPSKKASRVRIPRQLRMIEEHLCDSIRGAIGAVRRKEYARARSQAISAVSWATDIASYMRGLATYAREKAAGK